MTVLELKVVNKSKKSSSLFNNTFNGAKEDPNSVITLRDLLEIQFQSCESEG